MDKQRIIDLIGGIKQGSADRAETIEALPQARQWLADEIDELSKLLQAVEFYAPRIAGNPQYIEAQAERARLRW